MPPIQSFLFEKYGDEKISVTISGLECDKIVFAPLYEVITIFVRLILINGWGFGFKNSLWGVLKDFLILVTSYKKLCFYNRLEDPLEIILNILKNLRSS